MQAAEVAAEVAAALAPSAEPVRHIRDPANFRKAVQRAFNSALISTSPVTRHFAASRCLKRQRPLRCQGHCALCQHRGTCRVRPKGLRNVLDDKLFGSGSGNVGKKFLVSMGFSHFRHSNSRADHRHVGVRIRLREWRDQLFEKLLDVKL